MQLLFNLLVVCFLKIHEFLLYFHKAKEGKTAI